MGNLAGHGSLREVSIEATVIGPCRHCGLGVEFWADRDCDHEPSFTRPLGVVSSWHRNPLVRCWRNLKEKKP